MKTSVAESSIKTFHMIGATIADQGQRVLLSMEAGKGYTRRELGVLAGIENSAAARAVNGLVKDGALVEVGTKRCNHTGYLVGAVSLSLADGA
jgi:Fic family protein